MGQFGLRKRALQAPLGRVTEGEKDRGTPVPGTLRSDARDIVFEAMQEHATEGDFNPWFSPLWYTSRYPDLREAGIDPLGHYLEHGWKEWRDPSGLFSTTWYMAQNPDVTQAGINPLLHFLRFGRHERRQPHPLIELPDYGAIRVGVVILSFNAPDALRATLDSLARAKNVTPFTVFLIENGSDEKTRAIAAAAARRAAQAGIDIRYIESVDNLGFPAGNNLGLRKVLEENFSHVCLMNCDVISTTGWLDRLVAAGQPAVGPVSNAVGNEQTIAVDYALAADDSAFGMVDAFARRWAESFRPALVSTDFLGFFCVLLSRSVVERVGYLDERFYPGSYEDDDYCLRIAETGFEMAIARHVYVHHFGSSSFSTLDLPERTRIGDKSRCKFEEKWERSWSDRTHLPLLSGKQDAERFEPATEREALLRSLLQGLASDYGDLTKGLMSAVAHYRHEIAVRDDTIRDLQALLIDAGSPSLHHGKVDRYPRRTAFGSQVARIEDGLPAEVRAAYTKLLFATCRGLHDREFVSANVLRGIQPIVFQLSTMFASGAPTLVLTGGGVDPVHGDEKDGYVQRVFVVDNALADRSRVYLKIDEARRRDPALVHLMPDSWRLEIADRDEIGEALLGALVGSGVGIYLHSLFGLDARSVRDALVQRTGKLMLDLHGLVPEEFQMCDDPFSSQVYDEREAKIAGEIDYLVCVSSRMADHFLAKHDALSNPPIICPIFIEDQVISLDRRVYNARPRAVYAGGTQKWQQIGKMVDLIADTRDHVDFTLFTPDTKAIAHELKRHSLPPDSNHLISRSATRAEVLKAYATCDFGILLREDSPVNRAACPTKLIEYLSFGIIPVLDSDQVGDFVDLGMTFVGYNAFRRGEIPSIRERQGMARANLSVIELLRRRSKAGLESISRAIVSPSRDESQPVRTQGGKQALDA